MRMETSVDRWTRRRRRCTDVDGPSRRASGLLAVLRWLRAGEEVDGDRGGAAAIASPDSDEEASSTSCGSTDTAASFSYVPPGRYTPWAAGTEPPPLKYVIPAPETAAYRARVAHAEMRGRHDRDQLLTLRTKYDLPGAGDPRSLPLPAGGFQGPRHRRSASESAVEPSAAARAAHVRGKRRAPPPPCAAPTEQLTTSASRPTAGRKKRMAPQPPPPACNDLLRLEGGVLRAPAAAPQRALPVTQPLPAPRPWYKRSSAAASAPATSDKRRSCNMSFLTNISELDRQTMQILERETLKMRYLRGEGGGGVRPLQQQPGGSSGKARSTARHLIAKFNAITGADQTSDPVSPPPPPLSTGPVAAPVRDPWTCPRCTLRNDYWRIICRACSAIKPYFGNLTVGGVATSTAPPPPVTAAEQLTVFGRQVLASLPTNGGFPTDTRDPGSTSSSDLNTEHANTTEITTDFVVDTSTSRQPSKSSRSTGGGGQTIVEKVILGDEISVERPRYANTCGESGSVGSDRDHLKRMLIEMKNSLSKRRGSGGGPGGRAAAASGSRVSVVREDEDGSEQEHGEATASVPTLLVVTRETTYENIKVRKPVPVPEDEAARPVKVSAACQTGGAPARVYANMEVSGGGELHGPVVARVFDPTPPVTNRRPPVGALLRELEAAITGGEDVRAATVAGELAQMKVPCTVAAPDTVTPLPTTNINTADDLISVDMYVEDRVSHRGPFPLDVRPLDTVADLRRRVEQRYRIPPAAQRWILGNRLAADDTATLRDHQVEQAGCPVFLYLVTVEEREEVEVAVKEEQAPDEEGWRCDTCTLVNTAAATVCVVCRAATRVPAEPAPADTYLELVRLEDDAGHLVAAAESFECLVCMERCARGDGVVLRACLHQFCRECLSQAVAHCEEAAVRCPYRDATYSCGEYVQEREVRALVPPAAYEQHLERSVRLAERAAGRTAYHCATRDCAGWCFYEDAVNVFKCPACNHDNCLTCRAVHEGIDCATHQERARAVATDSTSTAGGDQGTARWLEEAVAKGEALECPTCRVVLMKKWGCDWLRCSMCRTEICWVTRGPRWGPRGKGDTSAGCRCGVDGAKCHPNCNYCH